MSSAVYFTPSRPIRSEEWAEFAQQHDVIYAPKVVGGATWYSRGNQVGVEVRYPVDYLGGGVVVSTFHMGEAMPAVVELAIKIAAQWSGKLQADGELRQYFSEGVLTEEGPVRLERHVGFTGTRSLDEVPFHRLQALREALADLKDRGFTQFHHGDCIGADEMAHKVARDLGYIIIHPPSLYRYRAWCQGDVTWEEKPYLDRNADIVSEVELMLAVPKDPEQEERRSGTWAAVRYARKVNVPVQFV